MEVTADILLKAYQIGVFPMAESRHTEEVFWVDPDWRGVIPLDTFHIPRRLRKIVRNNPYHITCNTAFADVLSACAERTDNRPETWINEEIHALYLELYERGHGHSIEVWLKGELVGGLYGVSLGGAFFGESMFSRQSNTSKLALVHLVMRLQKSGYQLLDTQFTNALLLQFGAVEIPRERYKTLLENALEKQVTFYEGGFSSAEIEGFLQSTTVIS